MAMDGLGLCCLVQELQPLIGSRIDKLQQPDKDALLLSGHGSAGRFKLLIHIHNELGRVQLTEQNFENPATAPAFCMLLRKKLVGSRLVAIEQLGLDRLLRLAFMGRDEFQDESRLSLVVELMGKHGNVFLLDGEERVLDCLRHIGLGSESSRLCLPNMPYTLPPTQNKKNPFTASREDFSGIASPKALMEGFSGISKQVAGLLFARLREGVTPGEQLFTFFQELKAEGFAPCLLPGVGPIAFTPRERKDAVPYATLSEAYSRYYRDRDIQLHISRLGGELKGLLERAKARCEKKLSLFTQELSGEEKEEEHRLYGELLLSYRGSVPRGAERLLCMDYREYPPKQLPVPIKKELSVKENAALYFKKYKKSKTARAYAAGQIESLKQELSYLEGQLFALSLCESAGDLQLIKQELREQGYLTAPKEKQGLKPQSKSKPLCFSSTQGVAIYVGKNNLQNEALTKNAPLHALWLHAKDMPGSHVLIPSGMPEEQSLLEAAQLAAYFSKGRGSSKVPVDYVLRRYVKKPAGSKPGFVIFTNQRTLYVTPKGDFQKEEL